MIFCNCPVRQGKRQEARARMFFFEKKNQKTCNCLGKEGKRQQECSFLKKRTKKLLGRSIRTNNACRFRERQPIDKSFLVLFFKKEHSCLALLPLACRTWAVTKTFFNWLPRTPTACVYTAALAVLTLAGCGFYNPPTAEERESRTACNAEADRIFAARNRYQLSERAGTDSPNSANSLAYNPNAGLSDQYEQDKLVDSCLARGAGPAPTHP